MKKTDLQLLKITGKFLVFAFILTASILVLKDTIINGSNLL